MPTPHLDILRLAQFQKEMQNSWIPNRRVSRDLPPISGKVEKTMDEVLEQVRQSAKELAEKSPRLEPKETCDFDNREIQALRRDLEQLMFHVGMEAGRRGVHVHAWIEEGCSGGCEKPEFGDCELPQLVLSSVKDSIRVYINLKDPSKSLISQGNTMSYEHGNYELIQHFFKAVEGEHQEATFGYLKKT